MTLNSVQFGLLVNGIFVLLFVFMDFFASAAGAKDTTWTKGWKVVGGHWRKSGLTVYVAAGSAFAAGAKFGWPYVAIVATMAVAFLCVLLVPLFYWKTKREQGGTLNEPGKLLGLSAFDWLNWLPGAVVVILALLWTDVRP